MKILILAMFKALCEDVLMPVGFIFYAAGAMIFIPWFTIATIMGILAYPMEGLHLLGVVRYGEDTGPRVLFLINGGIAAGIWIIIGCIYFCMQVKERMKEFQCKEDHKMYRVLGQRCPCMRVEE
jgi:hypothetical protein